MSEDDFKSIKKLLVRVGEEAATEARKIAPYDTSNLHNDIQVFDSKLSSLEIEIGNSLLAPYARFVHEGTGLYGKYKQKIVPKTKKALKTPFGVFKSTKGQKAQPYLTDAVSNYINSGGLDKAINDAGNELSAEIFKKIKEELKTSLKNITIE